MHDHLRILLVAASEDAAALLARHLRRDGIAPRIRRAGTPEGLTAAFADDRWDAVLCDHGPPGFAAPEALCRRNELAVGVPFIVIARRIDRAELVDLMRAGADDVIEQRDLNRLVPAIERAMRDAGTRAATLHTQEALRRSEECFRLLVDLVPDGVMIVEDSDDRICFANPAALEIFGAASADQIVGRPVLDLVHPGDRKAVEERRARIMRGRRTQSAEETRHVRLDGSLAVARVRAAPFTWNEKPAILVVLRDLSVRKRNEKALRESENYLRTVIDNSVDGILTFDAGLTVHTANPAAGRIFDRDVDDIVGRPITSFIGDDLKRRLAPASTVCRREARSLGHDGEGRAIEYSVNEMPVSGRPMFTCFVRDITELRESEQRYRSVVDVSPDGIVVVQNGKMVFANPAFGQLVGDGGADRVIGMEATDLYHEEVHDFLLERRRLVLAERLTSQAIEVSLLRPDGAEVPCETRSCFIVWKGRPAVLVVSRDITERKRSEDERATLEQQLRQAHKMEALGTLAGGIAHEFNNLLQPITLLTELVMHGTSQDSQAFRNLGAVLQNSRRAAQLVDRILSFGHRDERHRELMDLRKIVREGVELLKVTLPATIAIRCDMDEEDCVVFADEAEMHQLLINLASNAAHAMDGKVGALTIAVRRVTVERARIGRLSRLEPGRFVRLSVADTGVGMDNGTMDRIFEPFFTTRGVGEGTGLGLSIIHGIVAGHGGGIDVTSNPGAGTTFEISLPLVEKGGLPLAARG